MQLDTGGLLGVAPTREDVNLEESPDVARAAATALQRQQEHAAALAQLKARWSFPEKAYKLLRSP